MGTKAVIVGIALLGAAYALEVFAEPQPPSAPAAAQQAKDGNAGKASASHDPQEQESDGPQENAAAAPKGEESFLPVRPKDFNPMLPPAATGVVEEGMDSFQPLGAPNILMAELRSYTLQLGLFTRWLALVAGIGALLFVAQVFYLRGNAVALRRLAGAASESADIAERQLGTLRESSQKDLRAYVYTNGAKGEMPMDKSGKYTVRVDVRNFGSTPAYGLSGWMTVFVGDMAHEKNINLLPHDSEIVETVLPPGGTCFYYACTHEPVAHEIKAIAASVRAIYAYGEIRYKDVFGIDRFSRFRIKCSGERNLASGSFDHCIGGNEAD